MVNCFVPYMRIWWRLPDYDQFLSYPPMDGSPKPVGGNCASVLASYFKTKQFGFFHSYILAGAFSYESWIILSV
jgi:hypothetical protein